MPLIIGPLESTSDLGTMEKAVKYRSPSPRESPPIAVTSQVVVSAVESEVKQEPTAGRSVRVPVAVEVVKAELENPPEMIRLLPADLLDGAAACRDTSPLTDVPSSFDRSSPTPSSTLVATPSSAPSTSRTTRRPHTLGTSRASKANKKAKSRRPTVVKPEPLDEDELEAGLPRQFEPALLLPHGYPPVEAQVNNKWAYLFFRFCAERQAMHDRRLAGVPRDRLSEDETMRKTFVGNCYRQLDPSSVRMREKIIRTGEQSVEEVCFRIFLFSGFYLDSTWDALVAGLGHTPSWKTFDLAKYESILYQRCFVEKQIIYYSGFQIVPPVIYFGRTLPHYAATLRMVMAMMEMGLPAKLSEIKYAEDASELIRVIPTFGGFTSMCLMCSLNEAAPVLSFYWRNFATCGPGSRAFLKRIFGRVINSPPMEQAALRWLYEYQWRYWARIGADPPHAWTLGLRPGMRVLDIENSLCWAHRYVNDFTRQGYSSLNDLPFPTFSAEADAAEPPAWAVEEQHANSTSKVVFAGDYEEEQARLGELKDLGDNVWEVEKVLGRRGSRWDKDGRLRVRWQGWMPEDDTWQRTRELRSGAEEAVLEWLDWEDTVYATIASINRDRPYTGPTVPKTGGYQAKIAGRGARQVPRTSKRTEKRKTSTRAQADHDSDIEVPLKDEDEEGQEEEVEVEVMEITEAEIDETRQSVVHKAVKRRITSATTATTVSPARPQRERKRPQRLIETVPLPHAMMLESEWDYDDYVLWGERAVKRKASSHTAKRTPQNQSRKFARHGATAAAGPSGEGDDLDSE